MGLIQLLSQMVIKRIVQRAARMIPAKTGAVRLRTSARSGSGEIGQGIIGMGVGHTMSHPTPQGEKAARSERGEGWIFLWASSG